ncbi:AAA family ATPase [Acrocarpospora sp. B8E8]|uniref:AAA family ATPase n=1 Tax=Acrocarpospora sp. B8E8 TaxID=3153572 RepID=UPI00325DCA60
MRLHRLRISAFGSFPGVEEVDFDTLGAAGLFLIHGPTGAGKTTVLDAVCCALYGVVPGLRNSARTLRCDHAPPNRGPEVLLEATIRGRRLRIRRSPAWLRPKLRGQGMVTENAKVIVEELKDDWVGLTTRIDEAGDLIGGLLGMNLDQFAQVAMLPQGEFARFLRADGDDRRKLLERLFSVRLFTGVEKWLADHRRETGRAEESLRAQVHAAVNQMRGAAGPALLAETVLDPDSDPLGWSAALLAAADSAARDSAQACTASEATLESARARYDQARALAERRHRHADAVLRRDELESTAEERADLETLLAEAAAADRVLPLILQHDHRTALARAAIAQAEAVQVGDVAPEELAVLEQDYRDEIARLNQLEPEEARLGLLRTARTEAARELLSLEKTEHEINDRLAVLPDDLQEAELRRTASHHAATTLPLAESAHEAAESTLNKVRHRDSLAQSLTQAQANQRARLLALEQAAPHLFHDRDHSESALARWERGCREEAARLQELSAEEARLGVVRDGLRSLRSEGERFGRAEAEVGARLAELPEEFAAATAELGELRARVAEIPAVEARCLAARGRFDAALRREELADELAEAEEVRRAATDEAQVMLDRLLAVRQARIDGMAAELAASLVAGEACVVCGSEAHPAPAESFADAPGAEDEEAAQADSDGAQSAREAAESRVATVASRLESAADQADGLPVGDAEAAWTGEEDVLSGLRALAATEEDLAARVETLRGELESARERAEEVRRAVTELRAEEAALLGEQDRIVARLDEARCDDASVAERRTRIAGEADLISAAADAVAGAVNAQAAYDAVRDTVDLTEEAAVQACTDAGLELARVRMTAAREPADAREVSQLTAELADLENRGRQNAIDLASARTRAEQIAADENRLAEIIRAACGDDPTLTVRMSRLAIEADRLRAASAALRSAASAEAERETAHEAAVRAALDAGFRGIEDARAAVRTGAERTIMTDRLNALRDEHAAITALLSDPELLAAAAEPPPDLARLTEERDQAEHEHEDRTSTRDQARHRHDHLTALSADLATAVKRRIPAEAAHLLARRMAELANGTSTDNQWDMALSAYVLGERLRQVVDAANDRLTHMSGGRYLLQYDKRRSAASRTRSGGGLGLRVLDAWTGIDRDPATLSGGESFITSLALALGLADVVTAEAGGTDIGTLFVDEGFGTLDEDTLDDVLDILDSLRQGGRAVGVISHVSELRTRIPTQLQVKKSRTGSTLTTHA